MGFIYGLAVTLILFEGIIIQCEGTGSIRAAGGADGASSSNQREDIPTIDSKCGLELLPKDSLEEIVVRSGNDTILNILRGWINHAPDPLSSHILQNSIVRIEMKEPDAKKSTTKTDEGFDIFYEYDNIILKFHEYQKLILFSGKFGEHVKKIQINLMGQRSEPRILNIIKEYVQNVEELRIVSGFGDEQFWEILSSGKNGIIFPEVKQFKMIGVMNRNEFKLDSIFPKLEYLTLDGDVADKNCMDNLRNLKDLKIAHTSIPEDKLDHIFPNNKNMINLSLWKPKRRATMQSIADHLKELKILEVLAPGEEFLLRTDDDSVCVLPSVEDFYIIFYEMHKIYEIGKLSFHMPKLQKLTLDGESVYARVSKFSEHFKGLKTWKLLNSRYIKGIGYTFLKYSRS